MSNAQGRIFQRTFNTAEVKEIPFNEGWCNGTGYFDKAVKGQEAPVLTIGEMVRSRDGFGRRLIIIGTRFGNVVVFDRFTDQIDNGVWVVNHPSCEMIKMMVDNGAVGERDMITLLGSWGNLKNNIGFEIEKISKELYPSIAE